jgi:release factor glutamine methyltransferase
MRAPTVEAITSKAVEAQTIGTALRWAREKIAPISATADIDAEILLRYCIDQDHAWLLSHSEDSVATCERFRFHDLVQRRATGEPIAHITGVRGFWSFDLHVTPDTLIPRPETELLVEHALARIPAEASWHIADLGTGCGAIALAIATERPKCRITATDISDDALVVARHNRKRFALPNIEFRCGDWFAPVASRRFDVIIANPPYVAQGAPHLGQGDLQFEPRLALISGTHGLDALKIIVAQAPYYLEPKGWILVEHGFDQAGAVRRLMLNNAGRNVALFRDYASLDRISACQFSRPKRK